MEEVTIEGIEQRTEENHGTGQVLCGKRYKEAQYLTSLAWLLLHGSVDAGHLLNQDFTS